MSFSRRQFFGTSAAVGAVVAAAAMLETTPVEAADIVATGTPPALPPIEVIALPNRYTPRV